MMSDRYNAEERACGGKLATSASVEGGQPAFIAVLV